MTPIIVSVISLTVSVLSFLPGSVVAYVKPIEPTPYIETLDEKISRISQKYAIKEGLMRKIIECESKFIENTQSTHTYKHDRPDWGVKKGDQEKSFGLVQIHLPSHPNITYEQAIDPDFALDFLAKNLAEDRGYLWSCYKQDY